MSRSLEASPDKELWSEDAERAVLGAMLISRKALETAADHISAEQFYQPGHQVIFVALLDLRGSQSAVDPVSLSNQLAAKGQLSLAGGKEYLGSLLDEVPHAEHVTTHAAIVREFHRRRGALDIAALLAREASDLRTPIDVTLDRVGEQLLERGDDNGTAAALQFGRRAGPLRCFSLTQALTDPALLEPPAAVVKPFLYAGRVTLLSGREKSGKTTLLANAAAALTRGTEFLGDTLRPSRVLWITLDESLADTVRRFHLLGADPERLMLCTDIPSAATLRPVLEAGAFDLVCIDTLNELLSGKSLNRSEEVLPTLRPLVNVIRESGAAGCIVSHAGKSSGGYLGSVTIGGLVDAPLTLKRVATGAPVPLDPSAETDDDDDAIDDGRRMLVGLTRWGGKLRVRLAFDGSRYSQGDTPIPLSTRVLRELTGDPVASAALADRLGVRKDRVLEVVRELEARGAVKRAARGGSSITDVGLQMLRSPVPAAVPEAHPEGGSGTAAGTAAKVAGTAGNRSGTGAEPHGNRSGNQRFPGANHRHAGYGTATRIIDREGVKILQELRPTAHGERWFDALMNGATEVGALPT